MPDVPSLTAYLLRMLATAILAATVLLAVFAPAALADPELIQCPNNAHVWNAEQCDNFDLHDEPNGGSPGRGFLGGLLHTLTGGLL